MQFRGPDEVKGARKRRRYVGKDDANHLPSASVCGAAHEVSCRAGVARIRLGAPEWRGSIGAANHLGVKSRAALARLAAR
jgi:hypothetical protein